MFLHKMTREFLMFFVIVIVLSFGNYPRSIKDNGIQQQVHQNNEPIDINQEEFQNQNLHDKQSEKRGHHTIPTPALDQGNFTNGPLIYIKAHKVGGSAMCTAIEEMGKDAAPWKKCHKHQLQQCSWYGGLHKTFREIVDKGFDTFKTKYAGSIFAITMRDPGDRLLSMAEMRLGTSRVSLKEKEEGYSGSEPRQVRRAEEARGRQRR